MSKPSAGPSSLVARFAPVLVLASLAAATGCAVNADVAPDEAVVMRRTAREDSHADIAPSDPSSIAHESYRPVDEGEGPSSEGAEDEDTKAPPRDSGKTFVVLVGEAAFAPRLITIELGDAVEFKWQSGKHSVTSGFRCKADGMFASGTRPSPSTYCVTFLRTGIFPIFSEPECESMSGMVTVVAASTT